MILYAEAAAWFIRAAIFSLWLTGMLVSNVLNISHNGLVQGLLPRYLLLVTGGLAINLFISGSPKLYASRKPSDLIVLDQFQVSLFSTLDFLIQGAKSKKITRNIAFLSGLKCVSVTADGSVLYIENMNIPKNGEYFATICILIMALIALFVAPVCMFLVFYCIKGLLVLIDAPINIAGGIIKSFSVTIIIYYLFPCATMTRGYLHRSIRYFSKYITSYYGYPVFSSPLITFLRPGINHYIGLADPKGRIFINHNYFNNNEIIFKYVIAHEAGHLSDKYFRITSKIISPLLYPFTTFIFLTAGNYLEIVGNASFEYQFKMTGLAIIGLITIYWIKLIRESEYRADDFATKEIGFKTVIMALEELSLNYRTLEGMFTELVNMLSFSISFDKRLERLRKRWKCF